MSPGNPPMSADPILVAFLQQFDPHQTPTLGLDGSCAIAPGCELWQRASCAVAAHLGPTVNGLVHGFEQTPAAGERGALLQACLASHEANRAVRLLIDNQALVQRLHRGMRLGQWGGDLFPYWQLYQDAFGLMALLVLGFPRIIKFLDGAHPKGGLMFCVAACSMPKRMLARLILQVNFGR